MKFGVNRLNLRDPISFAASASRAEQLGWDLGVMPTNPLKAPDPYVCLALAAQATSTLELGTLVDNPVVRHPSVLAGSIATVAGLAPDRMHLGLGVGDTAVRFNGLKPATVAEMTLAIQNITGLLRGERVPVPGNKTASLAHYRDVPVWVAAQGPKLLKVAGHYADGVWLRVGRRRENLEASWNAVLEGAREAGRDTAAIDLGLIFHTVFATDKTEGIMIARAMAAGYFEYSPILFERLNLSWAGGDVHELRKQAPPDFHHHRDPVFTGQLVSFLSDEAAESFALYGDWDNIASQLTEVLELGLPVTRVILHPVLAPNSTVDFISECAKHLIPSFR